MMNDMNRPRRGTRPAGPDDEVTRLLREHYAPPADAGYWDQLEASIMRRVRSQSAGEWWEVLSGWGRAGLAAAAVAAVVVGALAMRARAEETHVAYEAVLNQPEVVTLQVRPDEPQGPESVRFDLPY
jgi:hypothetical protein